MADTIGIVRAGPNFEFHIRAYRLVDGAGNTALPDGKIESDIEIAGSIWMRTAGIAVKADAIQDYVSDEYFTLTDEAHYERLKAEFWIRGQPYINVFYPSTASYADGQCSATGKDVHGIFLTDEGTDDWRGIALAHELGHYVDLFHTKSSAEDCDDIDKTTLDPGNLMAQRGDGRTNIPADIHLTSCQVGKARATLYSRRADLIAAHIIACCG